MPDAAGRVVAIARAWLAISDRTATPSDTDTNRFVALWIAFNALYALKFDDYEHDSHQVRAFGRWDRARAVHRRSLTKSEYAEAIADLAAGGVYNYRTNSQEFLPDQNDLERVMVLAYQVRCNLFHGRKSPLDFRDQTLIHAAHVIVRTLVSALIEEAGVPNS